MTDENLHTAFIQAFIAAAVSGAVTYWLFRTVLRPKGPILTRHQRGRLFAAYAASLVLFTTLGSAINGGGDIERIIPAVILPPFAWAIGFAVGWMFGPRNGTSAKPVERDLRSLLRPLLTERIAIALIVALAIVASVGVYSYFSPYNSCVRGMLSSGVSEYFANFRCAQQLGGAGS